MTKEERSENCGNEIANILEKYGCVIIPELRILGKEIISNIHIIAKELVIEKPEE